MTTKLVIGFLLAATAFRVAVLDIVPMVAQQTEVASE